MASSYAHDRLHAVRDLNAGNVPMVRVLWTVQRARQSVVWSASQRRRVCTGQIGHGLL
ncbi:MAG: hypothetical protein ACYCT0_10840 [Sulfobacillus sp.]